MPQVYPIKTALAAACWLLVAACLPGGDAAAEETIRCTGTRRLMGVPWTITLHAASAEQGEEALAAAFAEVHRLETILSDYDATSELSRLSATAPHAQPQAVGADLWQVLTRAVEIRDATGGAFDPTVGPLTTLWRQARRSGEMPRPEKLLQARGAVGAGLLRLFPETQAVKLMNPGMRLDLGGIGMGFTIDRTLELLRRRGVESAMIDASGDIGVSAAPPHATGWKIAVAPLDPAAGTDPETLLLAEAAITTSGDAHQGVEIAGRRYSHIVDPRTGRGVEGFSAVTVIAPDATTADAMATAASVLGPVPGMASIAAAPGCSARFVWREHGKLCESRSPGWPGPFSPADDPLPTDPAPPSRE